MKDKDGALRYFAFCLVRQEGVAVLSFGGRKGGLGDAMMVIQDGSDGS